MLMVIFSPDVISRVLQYVGLRDMDALLTVNRCFQDHITHHPVCVKRRRRFLHNWKRVLQILSDRTRRSATVPMEIPIEYLWYEQKARLFEKNHPCLFFSDSFPYGY